MTTKNMSWNSKPFLLRPAGKDYLWGGRRLNDDFTKGIDMDPLAETWECSTHPDGLSIVASGEFEGQTLAAVLEDHPEFLGIRHPDGKLPLLVKFIDAKNDLSVQVHPNDAYAMEHENGQSGKSEFWYVLDAAKGAHLVYGLKRDCTEAEIRQAIADGTLTRHLQQVPIQKDDLFFIEAGTIHAIGAGALIAEIQENSNLTYRLYDYNRVGKDGRLWAVNPENGFFGVAPGTNDHSNPNALAATRRGTIFTNVALDTDNMTVWWEGLNKELPEHCIDWTGKPWYPEKFDKKDKSTYAAHPNSRFTAPAKNCPCVSPEFDSKEGVPLSAIIFGGRRATTTPLVYQSRDWNHGVFVGSAMSSETTAAATGATGVLRHDPMAMKPFAGYHMGDYFGHWIDMGKMVKNPPKIFNVNWFRQDKDGNFIWPGFGDNMRVLEWILKRCEGTVDADETAIGYVPKPQDIDLEGLDYEIAPGHKFGIEDLKGILEVDKQKWAKEAEEIENYYSGTIKTRIPAELTDCLEELKKNCK